MGLLHKNTPTGGAGLGNPALAAETAYYTTPLLQTGQGDGLVSIEGTVYMTTGAGTTALVLKLRQGNGVAGTILQTLPAIAVAASTAVAISFGFTDTLNTLEAAGGGQYTLTVTQTGGTGNGTANAIDIGVIT